MRKVIIYALASFGGVIQALGDLEEAPTGGFIWLPP